jgi:TonB family protein
VQYTIDEIGRTRDHVVVESSGSADMDAAAVASARQYSYSPRVVGGEAVPVEGVTTRIVFDLE